jgi:rfaE bifunctional protein kinase chain/domain
MQCKKILVVGDFMLDVYTFGEVLRISPEAPVPVLRVTGESRRPGGAGNAILNLISLGMEVVAVGRVGNDVGGSTFLQEMAKEGVDTRGVVCDSAFQTPLKNRMIATGQQIVRIDYEHPLPLNMRLEQEVVDTLPKLLDKVEIVAISDYAKGFLTPSLLAEVIKMAKKFAIPIIVDPKGIDFTRYRGATLIKPNYAEAVGAAGLGMEATLDDIAARILSDVGIETLMVTRSKEGISVFSQQGKRLDFPPQVHEVRDVTGAGDTVLAVVTAALANSLSISEAARLANVAAGIAIERIGCARISLADLSARLVEVKL